MDIAWWAEAVLVSAKQSGATSHLFRALVELAPEIVALIDADRVLRYVSPAVQRVTGYRPEELLGRPFLDLIHPEDRAASAEGFASNVATHEVLSHRTRFHRKDGSWASLDVLGRNYLDLPGVHGVLVFARDVTRDVELEETRRRSAEESADLFEGAPCGYHAVDGDGVYRRVNGMELAWLQRSREELIGRIRFGDLVAPASRAAYWEQFALLKRSGAVRDAEFDVVRKDGTIFPVLVQSVAIKDAEGRYVESRTTLYDITERRKAEEALRKLNKALEALGSVRETIIHASAEMDLPGATCRALTEDGEYRFACVHLAEGPGSSGLRLVASSGTDGGDDPGRPGGYAAAAVRTGRAQVHGSCVSLPVRDESGVIGVLSIFTAEDALALEELRVFEQLADDLAFGIASQAALGARTDAAAESDPLRQLSRREREVLMHVVEGLSSKEIARRVGLAPASVDTYRSRLMVKLGVEDLASLVRFAVRHGIIKA